MSVGVRENLVVSSLILISANESDISFLIFLTHTYVLKSLSILLYIVFSDNKTLSAQHLGAAGCVFHKYFNRSSRMHSVVYFLHCYLHLLQYNYCMCEGYRIHWVGRSWKGRTILLQSVIWYIYTEVCFLHEEQMQCTPYCDKLHQCNFFGTDC